MAKNGEKKRFNNKYTCTKCIRCTLQNCTYDGRWFQIHTQMRKVVILWNFECFAILFDMWTISFGSNVQNQQNHNYTITEVCLRWCASERRLNGFVVVGGYLKSWAEWNAFLSHSVCLGSNFFGYKLFHFNRTLSVSSLSLPRFHFWKICKMFSSVDWNIKAITTTALV